ncbi:hypothetical protein Taro_033519 [Colocasia esculenta]|uniref:Uncharacterized protein n=1 Tax=Colocasia esculenta TaxID=4460 RepID=A0A843VNZ7_COLES|nr:hypothetical protein [Colocasia esculenta]
MMSATSELMSSLAELMRSVAELMRSVVSELMRSLAELMRSAVSELMRSLAELMRYVAELMRSLAELMRYVAELMRYVAELMRSVVSELMRSLAELMRSLAELMRYVAELMKSLAELMRSLAELMRSLAGGGRPRGQPTCWDVPVSLAPQVHVGLRPRSARSSDLYDLIRQFLRSAMTSMTADVNSRGQLGARTSMTVEDTTILEVGSDLMTSDGGKNLQIMSDVVFQFVESAEATSSRNTTFTFFTCARANTLSNHVGRRLSVRGEFEQPRLGTRHPHSSHVPERTCLQITSDVVFQFVECQSDLV